ncbi:hypothetical protein LJR078_003243 [Arthrobacter sp. LjRoot78]|uniref:hypothetical protein n=1 Tax=Arthrobacter sp. LjRoot78 TaxID=3342338 RepID=UPI003ECE7241
MSSSSRSTGILAWLWASISGTSRRRVERPGGGRDPAEQRRAVWLGLVGIVVGAVLVLCSLEFVGPFESDGWKVAAALTPVTYIAWSLRLVTTVVAMLV